MGACIQVRHSTLRAAPAQPQSTIVPNPTPTQAQSPSRPHSPACPPPTPPSSPPIIQHTAKAAMHCGHSRARQAPQCALRHVRPEESRRRRFVRLRVKLVAHVGAFGGQYLQQVLPDLCGCGASVGIFTDTPAHHHTHTHHCA